MRRGRGAPAGGGPGTVACPTAFRDLTGPGSPQVRSFYDGEATMTLQISSDYDDSMPPHLAAVLDRFEEVVDQGGESFMALCPAHNDHNPSLHVSPGRGGR